MKRKCDEDDPQQNNSNKIICSGLNLIQEYEDDLEEEEDQKSLEETETTTTTTTKVTSPKKMFKLKLPIELKNMFQDNNNDNEKEEQELHGGRIRSFPHIRGNWSSFVGLPFSGGGDDSKSILEMSKILTNVISSSNLRTLKMDYITSPHLSLSRTIVFRHHWIDSFILDLKKSLVNFETFLVVFDEFEVYLNDDKTTTFIGMKINSSPSLEELVRICDGCLSEYKLETYYKNPSFHISLLWFVGDHFQEIKQNVLPELNKRWKSLVDQDESLRLYDIESVEFKCGNKLYTFKLT